MKNTVLQYLALLLCIQVNAQSTPTTQTLTGATTLICPQDITLTLQSSETNFNYFLRNAVTNDFTNDIINGVIGNPQTGTGSALNFQTGEVSETTDFHVFAANPTYALNFDGDDYVEIPHDPSVTFTDEITIDTWVKPTSEIFNQNWSDIYRKENDADGMSIGRQMLIFDNSDNDNSNILLRFGIETSGNGFIEASLQLDSANIIDQWTHILAFYDNTTSAMRLYINGVEVTNTSASGAIVNPPLPSATLATIGNYIHKTFGPEEHFKGKIAALRIWNTAPSNQQEVDKMLLEGQANLFTGNEIGLVAYYPFFEGAGTLLTDVTSNSNNGTINSATWDTTSTSGVAGGVGAIASNVHSITIDSGVVYVDKNATGNNNGGCWQDAFVNLQDALEAAASGQEIWVAQGTYKPDEGTNVTADDRAAAFSMKNFVSILGGFNGTETVNTDRDWENNVTILSGDIGVLNDVTDNSYQVIFNKNINGSAVLDGFTIEKGNANGSSIGGRLLLGGGGMYNDAFDDAILTSPTIYNCTFQNNRGNRGGAVYNDATSGLTYQYFENCVFQNNIGIQGGGAVYLRSDNTSSSADVELVNCKFLNNSNNTSSSSSGGALYLVARGGGMSDTHARITNCVFFNNTSGYEIGNGGAIYFLTYGGSSTNLTITNSTFTQNSASLAGGAIFGVKTNSNTGTANARIYNSIFWNNSSSDNKEISFTVTSTGNPTYATATLDHSIYNSGLNSNHGITNGGSNNDGNGFPSALFFVDGYKLGNFPCHPAIDAGDNFAPNLNLSNTDVDGNTRFVNATIDIGAVEAQSFTPYTNNTIYVDHTASGNNDGTTWQHAFTNVKQAVDVAYCLTEPVIHIAQGTYAEGQELVIRNPLTLKGGYPAGGGAQDIANNPTVLDGANNYRVIKAMHNTGTLFLEGLTIQNGHAINGGGIHTTGNITLMNSQVTNNRSSSSSFSRGGGIHSNSGSITLTNSQVTNNSAYSSNTSFSSSYFSEGGGIYSNSGNITLTNSQVTNNTSSSSNSSSGGGISSNSGSITLTNSQVTNNSNSSPFFSRGGGIYTSSGSITLTNSQITNNTSSSSFSFSEGGGIFTVSGSITLTNSQVTNNSASSSNASSNGGGIYTSSGSITLTNSQVTNNTSSSSNSPSKGGGIYGTTLLQNSILWGNTKSTDGGATFVPSEHDEGTLTASHSLIKNQNPAGNGNIDATLAGFAPLFVDEAGGDFRLEDTSPLVNAGNSSYLPLDIHDIDNDGDTIEIIPLDLDGLDRIIDATVDIGVYENQGSNTLGIATVNTQSISIYPNPVNNQLFINGVNDAKIIKVYNILGQEIDSKTITKANNSINVAKYASGIYLLKIDDTSIKFIKK